MTNWMHYLSLTWHSSAHQICVLGTALRFDSHRYTNRQLEKIDGKNRFWSRMVSDMFILPICSLKSVHDWYLRPWPFSQGTEHILSRNKSERSLSSQNSPEQKLIKKTLRAAFMAVDFFVHTCIFCQLHLGLILDHLIQQNLTKICWFESTVRMGKKLILPNCSRTFL